MPVSKGNKQAQSYQLTCYVLFVWPESFFLDSGWKSDVRDLFVSAPDMCQNLGAGFFCHLDPLQRRLELKIIFDGSWLPSKQTPSRDKSSQFSTIRPKADGSLFT